MAVKAKDSVCSKNSSWIVEIRMIFAVTDRWFMENVGDHEQRYVSKEGECMMIFVNPEVSTWIIVTHEGVSE
jgi:hypothetical protein